MIKVLFVCMGNICRSPMAEGVFTHMVNQQELDHLIGIDSAGTIDFHHGEAPDERMQETGLRHGVNIAHLKARQFRGDDFQLFHYILAMDRDNLKQLNLARPADFKGRIELMCDYAPKGSLEEVPDPYYGGPKGFEDVYDLVTQASEGLLDLILRKHFPDYARSH